jgi:hypothetical protein
VVRVSQLVGGIRGVGHNGEGARGWERRTWAWRRPAGRRVSTRGKTKAKRAAERGQWGSWGEG